MGPFSTIEVEETGRVEIAHQVEVRDVALGVGALIALAYPDRVAQSRGAGGAFLLANGRAAKVDAASTLVREPYLAVAEITGTAAHGRIVLAAALTLAEIEAQFADSFEMRACRYLNQSPVASMVSFSAALVSSPTLILPLSADAIWLMSTSVLALASSKREF